MCGLSYPDPWGAPIVARRYRPCFSRTRIGRTWKMLATPEHLAFHVKLTRKETP